MVRVARMKTQWKLHVMFSKNRKIILNIKRQGCLVDRLISNWVRALVIPMHIRSAREILSWVRKKHFVILNTVSILIKIIYLEVNYKSELIS
jgi:hypothetical protein